MSNNYIPNTASIPNVLFDYWMGRLSPAEFKVLMCIARKTYGWNKLNDLISIKQIELMTGLHRSGIIKNIDKLVEIGIVNKIKSKTPDGDDAPNRFEINVDCVEGGSLDSRPPVVDSVDYGVVYSVDPQNTIYTKPTITKNTPPIPPQKEDAAKAAEIEIKPSQKSKREKSDFPPKARELATEMINSLTEAKEDYSPPKNLSPILTECDFILRVDKRDFQTAIDVFKWALSDSFWADKMFKPNPAKYLRGKFDQLHMKMNMKPPKNPNAVDRRLRDKDGEVADTWKDELF